MPSAAYTRRPFGADFALFCRSQSSDVITFDFGAILRTAQSCEKREDDNWAGSNHLAQLGQALYSNIGCLGTSDKLCQPTSHVKKYLVLGKPSTNLHTDAFQVAGHITNTGVPQSSVAYLQPGSVKSHKWCRGDLGRRLAIADREAVPFQVWNGCNWGLSMIVNNPWWELWRHDGNYSGITLVIMVVMVTSTNLTLRYSLIWWTGSWLSPVMDRCSNI